MAMVLRTVSFNGEDCMLVAISMSVALRAWGLMLQFYIEKEGKYLSVDVSHWKKRQRITESSTK